MPESKTIFLIRHAESKNNVDKREAKQLFRQLLRGRLPSCQQLRHVMALLRVDMNSGLSEDGQAQVVKQHCILREANFVEANGVQLIAHSPLTRAEETFQGLFSDATATPKMLHAELFEKDIAEHIHWRRLDDRVARFETWLEDRPESSIVLVGHSAFFRAMVPGLKISNVDVWKVSYDPHSTEAKWGPPLLLFPGAVAQREHGEK
mmetsp:Transcript_50734/g.120604  ORF Transcript_50734/g.120604 Transcript_50734/m.120604 type:complete len:206 (+) Transcript_50734:146-763(+)